MSNNLLASLLLWATCSWLPLVGCSTAAPLPPKAVQLNELGATALQEGDLEAAGARLNLALEYNPEFVEAVTNLGLVELQRGNSTRARQLLERAKRLNGDLAQPHHGLGVLAEREFRLDAARQHYEAALAVDPGFVPARANLAALLLEQGLHEDALLQYRKLSELAPESVLGHRGLTEALIALRRHEEALAVVENALPQFPGDPSLVISLARLSLQADDPQFAVELLLPLSGAEDDFGADAAAWLAVSRLAAQEPEAAVESAQRALSLLPDHPLATFAMAVGLDTLGAPEAEQWLRQALRLNPNHRELAQRLQP